MEHYDAAQIGKRIAFGGEHIVYDYATNEVIKFSLPELLFSRKNAETKALFDLEICQKYFGEYFVPTRIAVSLSGKRLAKIQQKIVGRPIVPHDLHDPHIREQYADILTRHDTLVRDSMYEIDLVGQRGIFSHTLTNIFVTTEGSLRLIDATLLYIPGWKFLEPLFSILRSIVIWRQQLALRTFQKHAATYK